MFAGPFVLRRGFADTERKRKEFNAPRSEHNGHRGSRAKPESAKRLSKSCNRDGRWYR